MKHENIDFSMIHIELANENGDIRINMDRIPKAIYNDVQGFIIDGYEPNIEKEAVIYSRKIIGADKEQLQELIQLMSERLNLCDFRRNEVLFNRYKRLIQEANKRLLEAPQKPDYPFLTKQLSLREQEFLFNKLLENGFIECDFKEFCFAIGGTYTQNFKTIKWRKSLQTLRMLLEELRDKNIGVNETMLRADLFFTRKDGQPLKMPNRKRNECSADETTMDEIIKAYKKKRPPN